MGVGSGRVGGWSLHTHTHTQYSLSSLRLSSRSAEPTQTQTLLRSLGELVTGIYVKYWIYVCAGMFIVVSFAGRLVVYKIVYMFLFLLCLTLFQVPTAMGR